MYFLLPLLPGSLDGYNLQVVCCPEKHVAELLTTRDVEEFWLDIAGSRCDGNMSQACQGRFYGVGIWSSERPLDGFGLAQKPEVDLMRLVWKVFGVGSCCAQFKLLLSGRRRTVL